MIKELILHGEIMAASINTITDTYTKTIFKTLHVVQLRLVKLLQGTDGEEINAGQFDSVLRQLLFKLQVCEAQTSVDLKFS